MTIYHLVYIKNTKSSFFKKLLYNLRANLTINYM